jgi:hypothetical protein
MTFKERLIWYPKGATTLGIMDLYATLSIKDTKLNNDLLLCSVSHFIYYYAECRYAESRRAILRVPVTVETLLSYLKTILQSKLSCW